jgi:hypothetical protein
LFFSGKLEADNAPLSLVYHYFGVMFKFFHADPVIQKSVKERWDFLSTESTGISYMLTPKHAADGFYIDDDKLDILKHVNKIASAQFPGFGDKAEEEMVQFVSKMSALEGTRREQIFKLDSKHYWNIFGQQEFPTLYLLAKSVNEMICSSAASERIWSIYRFIHSRLRNRLSNEKVEMLAYVYVNCAIFDELDLTDYIADIGAVLSGMDCQNAEEED